ncbi:M14 family zinc carboxypeptidase [Kineococcus gynurae]|uniref:M14 family zinc carboxypeptidase n=1 Tax=Kineococcus gynurae TaxID=452979 RepID=A0ABV5LTE1_9ACTN
MWTRSVAPPRRILALALAPVAAFGIVVAAPAAGADVDPLAPPPCTTDIRALPITEFTDHRELGNELQRIAAVSEGRLTVSEIGRTNQDREIWSASVGTGEAVVLLNAEIHGNEKVGPDAILRVLENLATSADPRVAAMLDRITVVAVPKLNADGAELDRRGNDRTWADVVAEFPQLAPAPPAWNYIQRVQQGDDYVNRPGFDLNRDFHADLDYVPDPADLPGTGAEFGFFINPESQALRDLYVGLAEQYGGVDAFLDIHHQGACVARDDTGELIDVAVDYPPLPEWEFEEGGKYAGYENSQDSSRQLAISAWNGIEAAGYVPVRYGHAPERDLPGQARSAFALNGTRTVLFEIRGQTQTLGQAGRERFTRATVAGIERMLLDVSTGAVDRIDPRSYENLADSVQAEPGGGTDQDADQDADID